MKGRGILVGTGADDFTADGQPQAGQNCMMPTPVSQTSGKAFATPNIVSQDQD